MKTKLYFSLILIGLLSCQSSNKTALTHDQQRLVLIYVDLLALQQNVSPTNPAYSDSCKVIMDKHGISESSYSNILQSLNRQPEQWEAFYQAVLTEIDSRDQQQVQQNGG
ncbi:hypothetical protein HQ585_10860 [candidate division KSB1 bacterium]|nr:hypothetical protein [candidate division KSB1 bacterium]